MSQAATVIDFTLHRKRKQAQQQGRLLWAMYAQQAGFAGQPGSVATSATKTPRQA
ncbi:hypothetical protein [Pseudomonas japonica]|uniref:Uncharacterized protein n=1 Tax=Pseudomonas japonica TaxID=256466 RepID=A0A239L4R6_9PSED|nr:hypothetical protein [Pseudomonas japonica]SNT24813.1 hypothetical protein SAMN05444352_13137 [Pseudomonas japonica]